MLSKSSLVLGFAASFALAASSSPYVCTDFNTTVTASGSVQQIDGPTNSDDALFGEEVANALVGGVFNAVASLVTGVIPYTGTHQLFGHYCVPSAGIQHDTLHFLVHGVTFTHRYWDWDQEPETYSYQRYMAEQGYATVSIDRLGAGFSDYPDPIRVQQCNYEAAVNQALLSNIRAGLVPEIPTSSFSKIVYVGHSLGSIIGNIMVVNFPTNSSVDGIVLTGYSQNVYALQPTFLINSHGLPAALVNGTAFAGKFLYLTNADYTGRLALYGEPGQYDPAVVQHDEDTRGTLSDGEAVTGPDGAETASGFTKPVYILTGKNDKVFCAASLLGILEGESCDPSDATLSQVAASSAKFPDSNFSYTIQSGTGHNLNLHYAAPESYALIVGWLVEHGFS